MLHCPWNVAGHPAALAAAEREIGLQSTAVAIEPGRFARSADEILCQSPMSAFARERTRWDLLDRARSDFDVIHFNWGETPLTPPPPGYFASMTGPLHSRLALTACAAARAALPFHDLKALKAAGKVIAVTFQGDDIRQGRAQQQRYARSLADVVGPSYYRAATDRWKQEKMAAFSRYADLIYALNPDLLHDLPTRARFLTYANVDVTRVLPVHSTNAKPLVVHAPSDRRVKGTDIILNAVERLRASGVEFDFELVENTDHAQAMATYARADLVIDQLHAGFYGGVAVEAMALAKPVICYLRDQDLAFLPSDMRAAMPIVRATAEDLVGVLGSTLGQGVSGLGALGRQARTFVEIWHDPRRIAERLASDYRRAAGA